MVCFPIYYARVVTVSQRLFGRRRVLVAADVVVLCVPHTHTADVSVIVRGSRCTE